MVISSVIHAADASIPPANATLLPRGTEAILGYLGGKTPHVWTVDEWDRFGHLLQMGIWVPDPSSNPVDQARLAAEAAHQLGWFRGDLRGILIDDEANNDPAFLGEMGLKLREDGYVPLGYESAGVLNANPRLDGIVLAQPNQEPVVPAGQLIIGRQFKWDLVVGDTKIDLDVFDSSTRHLFGRGPRK
jgi:hypothetical protein